MAVSRHVTPAWVSTPTNPIWRAVDRLLGLAFGGLARLRRTRSIHPRGITHAARVTVTPRSRRTGSSFLDSPGSYDALLRVSRGVGFSGELPDVIGWALRVQDAFGSGQPFDLMLASTGRAPIARHVLMPTRGFVASTASSLFRYDVSGRSRFLAALPIVTGSGTERTVPEYRLCIASRWGRWREVARVEVGEQAPAEVGAALHFNVVRNSDRSLHPAGWVQGLRNRAYVSSERAAPQSGRDDVEPRAGEPVVAPSVHG